MSGPLLLRARDGTERPIVEHTTQMQDGGGRLAGAVLVMRDQTQERRYERALRESEERFRGLVEQALAGIYILGDSGFLYANPHLATIFRAPSPAAFMDRAPMDLVTPEHRERVRALTQRFFRGELDEVRYSFEGLRFDGTRCALEVQVRAVLFEGKRAAIGVLVDQTERDRVERELVESVARAQAIFDQAAAGMAEVDPQSGRFLRVNDRYCQMLGYTRDELLARSWVEVTHPEDRPPDGRAQPLAETYLRPTEKRYLHKDGSTVWATVHVAPLRSSSTSLAVVSDITKRKLAEAALRESESQLASLLRVAVTGHIISRLRDGKIIEVNDAWSGYLGWSREEVLGKTTEELGLYVDPEDRARIFERMSREGRLPPTEVRLRRRAGGEGTFLITAMRTDIGGEPCFVGAWNDVTHLRNLEEQFRQSQKLESIGRLAGGVAHDFNNLLTVIICSAEAMNDDLQQGSPVHAEDLQEVQAAADRARELTRQLLTFARKQVINPVVLDLNAVVRGSEKLLRRVLGEDVDLRVETQAGLWSMLGDQGQVEQVLMNLAVNARDAMPAGGQLLLETSNLDVPADECGGAPASQWVRLRVRDTGTGMSPEVKAHLFEPFFTTKEVGKGTGLGLATVHGIVLQAGGSISVESTIGQGTTFEIRLPRASADPVSPDAGEVPGVLSGTETLLVVEDDSQTRRVTVRTLEKAGYRVLVAGDGELALAVARAWTGALDLVVTDVVMPRMSGRALVDSLRWSRPGLRSLFVSGYSQEAISHRGVLDPGVQFLPKPFTPVALLTRVRAILDASRG
ncbi:MAG: PAS domain S-box protein [Deltaproteobacteria bacterium]|nr:PAS domain S-box protein [Deltaproteobacteria bacterium]